MEYKLKIPMQENAQTWQLLMLSQQDLSVTQSREDEDEEKWENA